MAKSIDNPPRFWIYGLSAVCLLLIFTIGILVPDYWSYSLQLESMKLAQQASQPAGMAVPKQDAPAAVPTPQSQVAATPEIREHGIGAERIFETYGKLITMLLGFVSVLGVFVGFFVRKSLREIQEDVETAVEKRMKLWEEQKNMVLENLKTAQEKFEKITAVYDEMKKALDAFKKLQETEAATTKPQVAATEAIAASLDSDPTFNLPADEPAH